MSSLKKRTYHHGDLKNALIEVAMNEIDREGIDAVSLRKVGNAIGVSQAALYKHFKDKEALLLEVAIASFEMLIEAQQNADSSAVQQVDRVIEQGRAYVRFALNHPHLYRLMFGQLFSEGEKYPALQDCRKRSFILLQNAVIDSIPNGDANSNSGVAVISARVLVHGLSSLIIDGTLRPGKPQTRKQQEKLVDQVLGFYESALKGHS